MPNTTPNVRETLVEALLTSWCTATFRGLRDAAERDVNTILTALAALSETSDHSDHRQTIAELAHVLTRADHAEKAAVVNRERADEFRRERDGARREQAQLRAERAAAQNRVAALEANGAELLARIEQAEATIKRTQETMQRYINAGSTTVNLRQVINLLSPTWPDGNTEAAPAGDE